MDNSRRNALTYAATLRRAARVAAIMIVWEERGAQFCEGGEAVDLDARGLKLRTAGKLPLRRMFRTWPKFQCVGWFCCVSFVSPSRMRPATSPSTNAHQVVEPNGQPHHMHIPSHIVPAAPTQTQLIDKRTDIPLAFALRNRSDRVSKSALQILDATFLRRDRLDY